VKVATLNLGDGPDAAKARALDTLVKHGAQIIGLQEAGDRQAMLLHWCLTNGWDYFGGNGEDGATSTPIIWDKAVHVSHKGTRPATPATNAGRLGAGPNVVKAKVWNHVRVHGEGGAFVFINGHLPASLYLPRRRALARKQIAVLVGMVKRRDVPVVVVGDFNARPTASVLRPLRRLGMTQHTHRATHGRRTIDLTWTLGLGGRAEVVTVPSDHKSVVLNLKEHR
jgi:endonuclease/exonuclease/phosphatase family metal-dependent hydrolase